MTTHSRMSTDAEVSEANLRASPILLREARQAILDATQSEKLGEAIGPYVTLGQMRPCLVSVQRVGVGSDLPLAVIHIGQRGLVLMGLTYLHDATEVELTLTASDGEELRLSGAVRESRYVRDRVHRVDVGLHSSIDPIAFVNERQYSPSTSKLATPEHINIVALARDLGAKAAAGAGEEELTRGVEKILGELGAMRRASGDGVRT